MSNAFRLFPIKHKPMSRTNNGDYDLFKLLEGAWIWKHKFECVLSMILGCWQTTFTRLIHLPFSIQNSNFLTSGSLVRSYQVFHISSRRNFSQLRFFLNSVSSSLKSSMCRQNLLSNLFNHALDICVNVFNMLPFHHLFLKVRNSPCDTSIYIFNCCHLVFLNFLMFYQKRDNGTGTLTSTSDKSSGVKSTSTPSTPKAESVNIKMESRLSHSLPTESTPSEEHLPEARHDREVPEDNLLGQETPLVCDSALSFG